MPMWLTQGVAIQFQQLEISMKLINRQAVVVRRAQPFVDWVQSVDEQLDADHTPLEDELIRGPANIYLLRDFDYMEDLEKHLKKRARDILEEELAGWFTDPDLWPDERGWKTFDAWLDWELIDIVCDVEGSPVVHQDFSPGST